MNPTPEQHRFFLEALNAARRYRGFCAPNPAVGAVVVKNSEIIGCGAHHGPHTAHAEVAACEQLTKAETSGADLYVTLEPCCHHGRTPPCTEFIAAHQLRNVFYAFVDPNPQVRGKSAEWLKQQGITATFLSVPEINEFYRSYAFWWQRQRPWVTCKLAMSLNAKIAGHDGEPLIITGAKAERYTHQCRYYSDALLTTVETIVHDNPSMNVRLDDQIYAKPLYILDREARLPLNAKIFQTAASITAFHGPDASVARLKKLSQQQVRCIEIAEDSAKHLDLLSVMKVIGEDGKHDLWVETGGNCYAALYDVGLINTSIFYYAPKIFIPTAKDAFPQAIDFKFSNFSVTQMGEDLILKYLH